MKHLQAFFLSLCLALGLTAPAAAIANHYVDSAAPCTITCDGSTWAKAWKTIAAMNSAWSATNSIIGAGDTVYISGGAGGGSLTYPGHIVFYNSGTSTAYIKITNSTEAGHNGQAIIDATNNGFCADTNNKNYVEVSYLKGINGDDTCLFANHGLGIVFQFNILQAGGDNDGGNGRGIDIRCTTSLAPCAYIVRNTITTDANSMDQTDCVYMQDATNVLVNHNSCIISNINTNEHNDCYQVTDSIGVTIELNYCELPVTANANDNHGIWTSCTRTGGLYVIRNNILWIKGAHGGAGITHDNDLVEGTSPYCSSFSSDTYLGKVYILNNTVFGGIRTVNLFSTPSTSVVENNILVPLCCTYGNPYAYFLSNSNPSVINYNLVWGATADPVAGTFIANVAGVDKTWSAWQLAGRDANGKFLNPLWTNTTGDFHLQSTSPAKNTGVTISGDTNSYYGPIRPQGPAWDMGASEQ